MFDWWEEWNEPVTIQDVLEQLPVDMAEHIEEIIEWKEEEHED